MNKEAFHINYVLEQLDLAAKYKQRVRLKAWKKDGNIVDYSGWIPTSGHWRGGIHLADEPCERTGARGYRRADI